MALFDRFFKPKWQHHDAKVRLGAVAELDDPKLLAKILLNDADTQVQAAILAQIDDEATLDSFIEQQPPPSSALLEQAKALRLKQLLPDREQLSEIRDNDRLIRIVSLTSDEHLLTQAIAQLGDDQARVRLANSHAMPKVRLCAAKGIADAEKLQPLLAQSQGKDKTLYRYCKDRLKEHREELKAREQQQQRIALLGEKVTQLYRQPDSPDYRARYKTLMLQWQELGDDAPAEQQKQITQQLQGCGERVNAINAEELAQQEREQEAAAAEGLRKSLIEQLHAMGDLVPDSTSVLTKDQGTDLPAQATFAQRLAKELDTIEEQWLQAQSDSAANQQQAQAYHHQLQQWRTIQQTLQRLHKRTAEIDKLTNTVEKTDKQDFQQLQQLSNRAEKLTAVLVWPSLLKLPLPEELARLQVAQAKLAEGVSLLEQRQEQYLTQLEALFTELQAATDDNHFKDADRAHRRIKQLLKTIPAQQQQRLSHQLKPLTARLNEIHDWQGFALEPKKVALCEQMTALVGSSEDVDVVADKINALQSEWKQLGAISPKRDQALWQQFHAAAEQAYDPCRKAFAARAQQRADEHRENLQKRQHLIQQLIDYEQQMDWASADWKAVQATLDAARAEFRQLTPLDPKQARTSQQAFTRVSDKIYGHIKEEYDRNIQSKQQLLESAEKLIEEEDIRQATDQVKKLQARWKQVGITPMGVDRKLWKRFRAACDALFQRLDQHKQAHKAAINAEVTNAEAIVAQAQQLLDNSAAESSTVPIKESSTASIKESSTAPIQELSTAPIQELKVLQQSLDQLPLPKSAQQRLSKQMGHIIQSAKAQLQSAKQTALRDSWSYTLDKIRACTLKQSDPDTAARLWQQSGELARGLDQQKLEQFWQLGPIDDSKSNDDGLRELCIALEILAEVESPEQDKEARMAYQVKRLTAGQTKQVEPDLMELLNRSMVLRPTAVWLERINSSVSQLVLNSQ